MLKERVEAVLEKVRVGLKSEGGDIELVDVRDNVVYVKLKGACSACQMSSLTMRNWVGVEHKKRSPGNNVSTGCAIKLFSMRRFAIGTLLVIW